MRIYSGNFADAADVELLTRHGFCMLADWCASLGFSYFRVCRAKGLTCPEGALDQVVAGTHTQVSVLFSLVGRIVQ